MRAEYRAMHQAANRMHACALTVGVFMLVSFQRDDAVRLIDSILMQLRFN